MVLCPVCKGRGSVAPGFYSMVGDPRYEPSTTAVPQRETCRACGGSGIVPGDNAVVSHE